MVRAYAAYWQPWRIAVGQNHAPKGAGNNLDTPLKRGTRIPNKKARPEPGFSFLWVKTLQSRLADRVDELLNGPSTLVAFVAIAHANGALFHFLVA